MAYVRWSTVDVLSNLILTDIDFDLKLIRTIGKGMKVAGDSNIATTSKNLKDSYSDLANAVDALPKF